MKNLSLLFIALLLLQTNTLAQEGWFEQISGTIEDLRSVTFFDDINGWIVGNNGTILHTSDGGNNWTIQQNPTSENLITVHFIDSNTGWACGGSVVLKTTNAGTNWLTLKQANNDTTTYQSVYFIDSNTGWIGEHIGEFSGSIIYKTTDGGSSWIPQYTTTINLEKISHIRFYNQDIGWATTDNHLFDDFRNGSILKTTNGGADWIVQYEDSSRGFISIDFTDTEFIWVLGVTVQAMGGFGGDSKIFKTTNSGDVWEGKEEFSFTSLTSVCFANNMDGWVVGDLRGPHRIYITTDGGEVWSEQNSPAVPPFYSVNFINDNIGWVVGMNGIILHTTNGGVSFVEEEEIDEIPIDYNLTNNFPNPFNPSTKIRYSVPQTSSVVIKVFDILGNEIEALVNEEKPTGTYEITWIAEQLPSGIYFYILQVGSFVETKKMVLIK